MPETWGGGGGHTLIIVYKGIFIRQSILREREREREREDSPPPTPMYNTNNNGQINYYLKIYILKFNLDDHLYNRHVSVIDNMF